MFFCGFKTVENGTLKSHTNDKKTLKNNFAVLWQSISD